MRSLKQWQESQQTPDPDELDAKTVKPVDKNDRGGLDPKGDAQIRKFKQVDLITLPQGVAGANCFNCEYIEITDRSKGIGFCKHKEVQEWVTKKMLCPKWSHPDLIRYWVKKDT